jgi:hypothetical protein
LRATAIIILLMVLGSIFVVPAHASAVTFDVGKDQVHVKMVLSLHQNMTTLPNQTSTLALSQDPKTSTSFNQALGKLEPSASLSNASLEIVTSNDWLNLTLTTDVAGVIDQHGDVAAVNMTWKSFHVTADLRDGNLSYNAVGSRYFRPRAEFYANASKFENNPNATIKAVNFFVNGTEGVTGDVAANTMGNITLLDFRPLNIPIDQWTRTYNLTKNTTNWTYIPVTTFGASITAQESNKTMRFFTDYSYDAEVTVPGLARASGDSLLIDIGSGAKEWVMAGIVVLALALLIVVQALYRSKRKAVRLGRR